MKKRIEPYQWVVNLRGIVFQKLGDNMGRVSPRVLNKLAKLFNAWTVPITPEDAEGRYASEVYGIGFRPNDFEEGKVKRLRYETRQSGVDHIVDYMRACYENGDDPEPLIMGVGSLVGLIDGANEYFHRINKKSDGEGHTVSIVEIDGYDFVALLDKKALRHEGKLANNCVGSYSQELNAGHQIISVRKDGKSWATLEIDPRKQVLQAEAPNNKEITHRRVRHAVLTFLGFHPNDFRAESNRGYTLSSRARWDLGMTYKPSMELIKQTYRSNATFLRNNDAQG